MGIRAETLTNFYGGFFILKSRIHILDSIRGLAILGILLVNIPSFTWPEIYDSLPSSFWITPKDKTLHAILSLFIQSSFYPIFATLFGVSMLFVFRSAEKKDMNPYFVFFKRLIILLIIGITHALFIWHGDILVIYAILGMLLLPFYQLKAKKIFITGLIIWLIPNVIYALWLVRTGGVITPYDNTKVIQEVIKQYQSGLGSTFIQNVQEWTQLYNAASLPFVFISIFPMMLFGLALAKSNLLQSIADGRLIVNYALIGSGVVGFPLKSLPILEPYNMLFTHLAEAFGGPLVGLFYSLLMIRLGNNLNQLQTSLSFVGRMSLSNYLFQSITGFLLFKVCGLYGETSLTLTIAIGLLIMSLQIKLSKWWMNHFSFGPVEYLWRKLTYYQISNH